MSTSLRRPQPPPGLRPLLSSFPTPPSHIPASPALSSPALSSPALRTPLSPFSPNDLDNPPPTGPPSDPLPPLPQGPSKVTEEEQIAFIAMRRASYTSSSSRVSTRSRPQSRRSSNSTSGDEAVPGSPVSLPSLSAPQGKNGIVKSTPRSMGNVAQRIDEYDEERNEERAPTPSAPQQAFSRFSPVSKKSPLATNDNFILPDRQNSSTTPDDEIDRPSSPDIAILIQRTNSHTPRSSTPVSRQSRRSHSSHSGGRRSPLGVMRLRSTPILRQSSGLYSADAQAMPNAPDSTAEELDARLDPDQWDSSSVKKERDTWDEIWEDAEVDDSDEDVIDLRTPLPHLMLRAGLLSPHSKLLPRPSPSPDPLPRSDVSNKKALPRDDRDTAKRRERHKDGNLLRGGIGLTTGLGWSDSEDEDAPSALTHRLSHIALTLSRKSSMASSLRSTSSVPFARSPSQSTISTLSTRSTTLLRAGSSASSAAVSRGESTTLTTVSPSLSRSTSSSTLGGVERQHDNSSVLFAYLSTQQENASTQDINATAYSYDFPPSAPADPGLDSALQPLQISGPGTWRPPRSPLFDNADPFARQYQYGAQEDRSPTPTNGSSGSGSSTSLSIPATPRSQPHSRPASKALPAVPIHSIGFPKTVSLSSLHSVSSVRSVSSVSGPKQVRASTSSGVPGQRERSMSNASVQSASSAVSAVRPRPSLPNGKTTITTRTRTTSTSSVGSVSSQRPLKPAIKPTSGSNGMVMARSRFVPNARPEAPAGIAI